MGLGESDTRAKLIDPALHTRGWTEDLIRREETAGTIEIISGKPRKRAKGRVDYTLRIKVNLDTQPVAVALIEAKAENLPPTHGLEQGKLYASCKRLNVPFVFSRMEPKILHSSMASVMRRCCSSRLSPEVTSHKRSHR